MCRAGSRELVVSGGSGEGNGKREPDIGPQECDPLPPGPLGAW